MAAARKNKIERIKHTLELDEKIDMHIKGWQVQRVGWVLVLAIMLAAALGVFGHGILSKKVVQLENAQATYERFFRYEAEMEIRFSVADGAAPTQVYFSQDYLKNMRIEQIVPEPKESFTRSGSVFFVFGEDTPREVSFYLMAEKVGTIQGEVGINNANFHLSQFIYP